MKVYLEDQYFKHIDGEYFDPETAKAYIEGHTANVNNTMITKLSYLNKITCKIIR